uniref:EGF-like domain-containing protein n=1 Tax=Pavo cristatus TaxID=9049 RepID=A0A8C9FAK7_PAVCR
MVLSVQGYPAQHGMAEQTYLRKCEDKLCIWRLKECAFLICFSISFSKFHRRLFVIFLIATCYPKCKNGGECLRPGKCRCPPGYGGRYCHKVSCEGGCRNGGECISVNGVVKCLCASGWTGSRCQEAICPQGCRNNGACVAPGICSCPAGWVGGACHLAVCKLPCQHGGKCIAPNVCRCRLPYSGLQCTKKRKE